MAKTQLLFFLVLVVFISAKGSANEMQVGAMKNLKEEDKIWVNNLANHSRKITMGVIVDKYKELIEMQGKNLAEVDTLPTRGSLTNNKNAGTTLKVFVSASLGKSLLKNYVEEARKYKATLVFNGLPDNSWQSLAELVTDIAGEGEEVSMQIDPEEFDRFNIKSVPAFVLSQEEDLLTNVVLDDTESKTTYDKVTGNIGITSALRLFVDNGKLSKHARIRLGIGK